MTTRFDQSDLLNPRIAAMVRPEDRAALGLALPDPAKGEAARESELQKLCEAELSRRGIEFLHLSPRARDRRGWPDLTFVTMIQLAAVVFGITPFAVELKTRTGRLSDVQRETLTAMERNGWTVRVVRTFDDFTRLLAGDTAAGERV